MKSLLTLLLICSFFLFTNCDNNTSSPAVSTASTLAAADTAASPVIESYTYNTAGMEPEKPVVLNGRKKEKTTYESKLEKSIDEEIQRQLAINPELPELNEVAAAYNNITVKLFTSLADETGGQAYMIDNASFVVDAITDIIKSYMTSQTDLVFLIDKTGSMSDDIDQVKKSVNKIIDALKPFDNARVGFAFYGDKYSDSVNWYSNIPLNNDFKACTQVLKNITTTGGGDYPESVNDGIVKTIQEMNWQNNRRRVILLIGDAPSLEPPFSDYTLDEVINIAKTTDVKMNFYPVVIGIKGSVNGIVQPKTIETKPAALITSLSPNPATNYTLVKTPETGDYTVEVFNISGELMFNKNFHDNNYSIMTDTYPTGVYVARIINNNDRTMDTEKFVVRH